MTEKSFAAIVAPVLGSALLTCVAASCAAPQVDRPNVLVIVWDTVRADRLGTYGYEKPTTPFLDEIASRSVVYERAVSPGMWTLPSHASLFTGLPVSAHGTHSHHKWLDSRFRTLAEILGEAGYDSYAFSANPHVSENINLTKGFATVEHPWDPSWSEAVRQHTEAKLIPQDRSTEISPGRRDREPLQDRKGHLKESGPVTAQALARWLDERDGSGPFFAFLNYMEAHVPRIPSLESRERVMHPDDVVRSFEVDQTHLRFLSYTLGKERLTDDEIRIVSGVYDAALVDLDAATRHLFAELERRGVLDDTIVVLTSDHGENLGDHSMIGHKYCVYNTLIRVPLVIHFPAALPPDRVSHEVSVLDVFASVLDMVDLPSSIASSKPRFAPGNVGSGPSGPAFSELVAATPTALKRVGELHPDLDWTPWLRTFRSVEHDGYKFIEASDGRHELYNLDEDPGETRNLWPEQRQRGERMQLLIENWSSGFDPYDPSLAGGDDRPAELPKPILDQLRALGYVE